MDLSEDGGATFERTPSLACAAGVIQPALWEPRPGAVAMLLRSDAGAVFRADSAVRPRLLLRARLAADSAPAGLQRPSASPSQLGCLSLAASLDDKLAVNLLTAC